MVNKPNYDLLPPYMQGGMKRYLENGIRPGDFISAVLQNDLVEAYRRADKINIAYMHNWVKFIYNHVPMRAQGSKEKFENWIKAGGLQKN